MSKALEKEVVEQVRLIREELGFLYSVWSDREQMLLDSDNKLFRTQMRKDCVIVQRIINARRVDLKSYGYDR